LRQRVATLLKRQPHMRWDAAVAEVSKQQHTQRLIERRGR
jgi:hypothetical protein